MAKRRTRKKKKARRAKKQPLAGWVWMLFGLAAGLSVSALVYVGAEWDLPSLPSPPKPKPGAPARSRAPEPEKDAEAPERKFSFYEMLPSFEVVIPEEESVVPDAKPVAAPGVYVLQAGSFSSFAEADSAKAQLAMLGVPSRIQKVSIEDTVYHRVRVGPVDDLDELNDLRGRLREAKIEPLVIRVGE